MATSTRSERMVSMALNSLKDLKATESSGRESVLNVNDVVEENVEMVNFCENISPVYEPLQNLEPFPLINDAMEYDHQDDPFAADEFDDKEYIPSTSDESSDEDGILTTPKNKKSTTETVASVQMAENVLLQSESQGPLTVPSKRSRQIRSERKRNRNSGKRYVTESGKVISAKNCATELPECRMNCRNRFEYTIRKELFDQFWGMNSRNRRADYLSGLITSQPKATQRLRHLGGTTRTRNLTNIYHLKVHGENKAICKNCFKKTFDVSDGFIKVLLASRSENLASIPEVDQRGNHSPITKTSNEKREQVVQHINSFPKYESHYSRRHTVKKYLDANLSVAKMYDMYKELYINQAIVSYGIYRQIFNEMNLSFKMPHNDTCNTCDTFNLQIKLAGHQDEKLRLQTEWNTHKDIADKHFTAKSQDKKIAKIDKSVKMISFDLQQVLQTPHIQTNIMFYKRQLAVYNLTIYDGAEGIANNFIWNETIAGRGANQIGSCLFKYLISLPEEVSHVIMYSDTCTGQNRNSHIAAMCFSALQKNVNLKIIDHKFMVSGHSHMECDTAHAMIEKAKKRTNLRIHHPRDWAQLIRSVGKKGKFNVTEMKQIEFLDFKAFYSTKLQIKKKDSENEKFIWHNVQWLRFEKDQIGIMQFKTALDDTATFKTISFLRRRQNNPVLIANPQYSSPLPISEEKKKDLLSILHLVDSVFHDFYTNLSTSQSVDEQQESSSEDEN